MPYTNREFTWDLDALKRYNRKYSAIYDVSANNDGATFASLNALLNDDDLGTLIPTEVRKGGMTIRFVCTSDNKYVQYLYHGTSTTVADFTNTANWEKTNLEGEVNFIAQKVGDVLLDLQGASVGKYLSDGTTNSDSAYNHKEIDATSLRGKYIAYRLGLQLSPSQQYPSDSCFLRKSDNTIVLLSSCRVNTNSDIFVVKIPTDAAALLLSWTIDVRYTTNPFIAFNYTGNIALEKTKEDIESNIATVSASVSSETTARQNADEVIKSSLALSEICNEINVDDYTVTPNLYIKTDGTTGEIAGMGLSVVQIDVKNGDCLFVRGKSGSNSGIVFTYNQQQNKYVPISSFLKVIKSSDHYYTFFKKFDEASTVYINRWIDSASNTSIALGNIADKSNTVYQQLKYILSQLNSDTPHTKYIPIGDSITDGTGATQSLGSYAARLNDYFGFDFYYPLAQGGLSVVRQSGAFADYPLLRTKIGSSQLEDFRGIVTVSVGTNDYGNGHSPLGSVDSIKNVPYSSLTPTPTEYTEGYTFAEGFRYDLETLKRKAPNATIIVLSPINRVGEDYEYITGVNLQSYRDVEKEICKLLGIMFVDMQECGISKWNTSPVWSADNLHPNDYGYFLMTSHLIPIFKGLIEAQSYLDDKLVE